MTSSSDFKPCLMDLVSAEIANHQFDAAHLETSLGNLLAASALMIAIISGANKDVIAENVTTSAQSMRAAALANADEILSSIPRPSWVSP